MHRTAPADALLYMVAEVPDFEILIISAYGLFAP
jgi:hypothetical protein